MCPWYAKLNTTCVCCDRNMLHTLKANSLKLAQQLLGRCPSCFQNFMNVFCAITYDPGAPSSISIDCLLHGIAVL